MDMLEVKQLTKKFGNFIAVDNLSFTVRQGEIFGLLGPNGAGKSTIIHMLASLLSMTEGQIKLLGKDITEHRRFAQANIGIVPQDVAIYEEMSTYENVAFFAGLYGLRGAHLKNSVEEALAFVGLDDQQKKLPKHFSGGMKRRLNIACTIAHKPKLIIMDEPTVGIDPHSRNYILNSVKQLNEMGSTVIYTSHYMEEVESICSQIAIIDHGKIIAEGTKEQLQSMITNHNHIEIHVRSTVGVETNSLERINGVQTIELKEQSIGIYNDVEVNNLNHIVRHLIEHDVEILSVDHLRPNLETVFLTLTGRSLRDG